MSSTPHSPGTPRSARSLRTPGAGSKLNSRRNSRRNSRSSSFRRMNLMAGAISLQAPEELSEEKVEELREVFMLFDKDGEETITNNELGTVMRAMGQHPTEAEMRAIIAEIDADGNGIIEFPEFVDLMSRRPWGMQGTANELHDAFTVFDHGSNGQLSLAELRHQMKNMGESVSDEDLDKMFGQFPTDGEGNVKYDAFVRMMMEEETGPPQK